MEKLQWQFELLDRLSGPAHKAHRALDRLQDSLAKVNGEKTRAGAASRAASSGLESWITKASSAINVAGALAGSIASVTTSLVSMGASLANAVIHQAQFHQSTMTTFNTLLRNEAGGGRREFAASLRLGSMLAGTTEDFVSQRRDLLTAGFTDRGDRDVAFALMQDMAAMRPDNPQIASQLSLVFGQILGQDRVMGNDLLQLQTVGVGRGDFARQLVASRTGRSADQVTHAEVTRMLATISHGGVRGNESLRAIAAIVQGRTGQRLGGFAAAQGDSIAGMMSNVMDAPATILQRFFLRMGGADGAPGMQSFVRALRAINDLLKDGNPVAERIMRVFEQLINGVFGELDNVNPRALIEGIVGTMERLVPVVISVVRWFRIVFGEGWKVFSQMMGPLLQAFGRSGNDQTFVKLLERTGQVLGFLVGVVAWFVGTSIMGFVAVTGTVGEFFAELATLYERIRAFFANAGTWLYDVGRQIVQGLTSGLSSGLGGVLEAMTGINRGVVDSVVRHFQIHSPSLVMADLGANVSEGFALGIERHSPDIHGAFAEPVITAAALANRSAAAAASAGGGINVHMTFQLPDGNAAPEAYAEAVRPIVVSAIAEALERAALEVGSG